MKKFKIKPVEWLIIIALLLGGATLCIAAEAPLRQEVTVTGGTGTFTYSGGIGNPAYSMFRIKAVITPSAATTTNIVKVVDGSVTNTVATKVVAANDSASTVTNDWWHFAGDQVLITCSATNAFTALLILEEQ